MKKLLTRSLLFTLLCTLAACANIDDLSDANTIKSFRIVSHQPTEIVLDEAEITPEDIILVPVKYGQTRFPMKFRVSVSFDADIDVVMGADLNSELQLESIDDRIEFVVVAKSGMSRKYYIQADLLQYEIPQGYPVSLVKSDPEDAILFRRAEMVDIAEEGEEPREVLMLHVAEPVFPLSLTVKFDTEGKVTFEDFKNGVTPLTFTDATTIHTVRAKDNEHGSIRDIEIGLSVIETVKGGAGDYSFSDIHKDDVKIEQLTATDKFRLHDYEVDNDTDKITLWLFPTDEDGEEDYEPKFPVSFSVNVETVGDDTQIFRMPEEIVFNGFATGGTRAVRTAGSNEFWYVDGPGGYVRHWKFEVRKYDDPVLNEKYSRAEVEEFSYRYTPYKVTTSGGGSRTAVTMDPDAIEIDREKGEIWLSLKEAYNAADSNDWKLELGNVTVKVSDLATVDLPEFVWKGNDSWKTQTVSFDVVSRDGTPKTWRVGIRDMRDRFPATACDITTINSVSLSPESAVLDAERPYVFDRTARTITVRLKEDGDPEGSAYPITVSLDYTHSQGAEIMTQNGGKQPLVFASVDDEQLIRLLAEDGETDRTYTVKLVYDPDPEPPVLSSEADVTAFTYGYTPVTITTTGGVQKPAATLDPMQVEIDHEKGEISLALTGLFNAAESSSWQIALENVTVSVSDFASVTVPAFKWQGNDSWKTGTVSFDVKAEDGTIRTWTVGIKDKRARQLNTTCNITGVTLASLTPAEYYKSLIPNLPEKTISIELSQHDITFPVTVKLNYTLSTGAVITSQSGGTASLVFTSGESTHRVRVLAEDAETWQEYTVGLIIPEKEPDPEPEPDMEANVARFTVSSPVPSSFSVVNSTATINTEKGEIEFALSKGGSCPLTVNYSMTMDRDVAGQDMELSGQLVFKNLTEKKTFTATAKDGNTKQWTIKITPFMPQLQNADMENWADSKTPSPAGSSSTPYWATPNMKILGITIDPTSRGTGKGGGYAAQLKTAVKTILFTKKLTSGSLFLGWFDSANAVSAGLSDPVKLTNQGIEFSAGRKLVAIEVDAQYSSAGSGNDTGTIAVELTKQNAGASKYVYHGKRPDGTTHPDNTAVLKARGRQLVGNKSGTQNGESIKQMTAGKWETIRVPIDYSSMSDPFDYTHLVVICASSSQGDTFVGDDGSTLLLDNFRLIYE
ncbi:PCMD domain-containing protein [Alistipes sp. OttesenSCG-928-B03]|nr:PCMD domain-containing protein [Alistipes sp. OttesenSCG-928-B03]